MIARPSFDGNRFSNPFFGRPSTGLQDGRQSEGSLSADGGGLDRAGTLGARMDPLDEDEDEGEELELPGPEAPPPRLMLESLPTHGHHPRPIAESDSEDEDEGIAAQVPESERLDTWFESMEAAAAGTDSVPRARPALAHANVRTSFLERTTSNRQHRISNASFVYRASMRGSQTNNIEEFLGLRLEGGGASPTTVPAHLTAHVMPGGTYRLQRTSSTSRTGQAVAVGAVARRSQVSDGGASLGGPQWHAAHQVADTHVPALPGPTGLKRQSTPSPVPSDPAAHVEMVGAVQEGMLLSEVMEEIRRASARRLLPGALPGDMADPQHQQQHEHEQQIPGEELVAYDIAEDGVINVIEHDYEVDVDEQLVEEDWQVEEIAIDDNDYAQAKRYRKMLKIFTSERAADTLRRLVKVANYAVFAIMAAHVVDFAWFMNILTVWKDDVLNGKGAACITTHWIGLEALASNALSRPSAVRSSAEMGQFIYQALGYSVVIGAAASGNNMSIGTATASSWLTVRTCDTRIPRVPCG